MEYAVIRGGQFIERRTYDEPVPPEKIRHTNGVPDLRPYTEVRPSYDPATEVLEGPSHKIANDLVTATWVKRAKTADEIDREKTARVESMEPQLLLRAFLSLHNRIRALEGQPTHTIEQLKTALKGMRN
jgi:hypothetical protein